MSVRSRFWLLATIRWLPTGLIVPVVALLPLDRGLSVAELGGVLAVQGVVVLLLELPTGGFADSLGRRPVWIASAVVAAAAYGLYSVAQTPLVFAAAVALTGVFRALDSGPLNAWFVDAVGEQVPEPARSAVVARGLAGYASVVGLSIATGALLSAGLVAWAPFGRSDALALPHRIACVLAIVQVAVAWVLMDEDRSARVGGIVRSVRATPRAIADGARLLLRSRVLRALVAVEVLWGFGLVAFESMTPVRLAELLDDGDLAATVMGPASAGAWAVSAVGAAAVPWLLRRWSLVAVSVALKVVQALTVVAMGVAAGPIGLVAGLLATYAVHSAAGAVYETLLHQQARPENRATVLSLASMAMHPGAAVGAVVLGAVATSASPGAAIVVGGLVLGAAAPLFLVGPSRGGGRPPGAAPPMLGRDGGTSVARDGVEARHD